MAYRQAPSPRSLARTSYIPENDPNRPAAQQEVMDAWDAQFGSKAQWDRNYQFVLQNTGDPEKARIYADSIASTQKRQELTQLATGVAGPATSFGREAIATARALRAAPKVAEEAPGAVRLLAGPSSRNAQTAEEMLTPNVIYGTSAEGAPRLTYARPETRYRMAVDRPAGGKPLANYEEPVWDQMYDPTDLYARQGNRLRPMSDPSTWGRGQVVTRPDPLDILAAEGGPSTEAVELAQRIARGNAENRALRLADEEARFAGGEGPNYAEDVLNRRRIAAGEEADFRANQLARMEEEGGGAGRQATINELGRVAEADFRARQMGTWDDEAGAITSGRNPPNPVSRALQVVEGRSAPSGPGTGFTMIDTPGQGFTMVNPPNRAVAMRNIGSEAAGPEASSNWYGSDPVIASAAQRRSFMPSAGQVVGAGIPAAAAIGAMSSSQRPLSIPANYNTDSGAFNLVAGAGAGRGHLTEGAGDRYASMVGAGRGIVEEQFGERAKYQAAQDALQAARERAAPPMPQRRPEGLGEQPGGLAGLFKDPYAGMSSRDLYMRAQEMERSGDESGANVLNLRAAQMGEGMASGGAAKPHKDAALHKALDIISNMLGRH